MHMHQALLMLMEVDEVASSSANESLFYSVHGWSMSTRATTTTTADSVGDHEEQELPEYESGCTISADSVGENGEEELPDYESGCTIMADSVGGKEEEVVPEYKSGCTVDSVGDNEELPDYKSGCTITAGSVGDNEELELPEDEGGCTVIVGSIGSNEELPEYKNGCTITVGSVGNNVEQELPEYKSGCTITADSVGENGVQELPEYESGCAITAGRVGDTEEEVLPEYESGRSHAELDDPLRGLEHMMVDGKDDNDLAIGCVPELTEAQALESVLRFPKSMNPIQLNIGVKSEVLSFPKSMEPVQLNIGLKAEVSRKLLNPRSDLQIRARYMKRAVPLDLHPIKDQLETECLQLNKGVAVLQWLQLNKGVESKEGVGKLGYTPAAQADKISRRTREMSPSLDAQGCDSLRKEPEKIVRCASPLSGGLPRATSLSRASRPAASIEKGVVPAIDSMHTDSGGLPRATSLSRASRTAASIEKGVVPATDSMHTDSGGLPRATSLSRASRAAASIEKGVVPATDSMHVEKGLVPATDSMHVEKGVVPATHSMHVEKKVVPATDSMHVEKGVVPATDSMHVEKKVAPATDSMHVDKGGVPATDSMHIEKGRVPATDSMHVEKGVVPATDSMHIEKGRVPATDSMHIKKGVVPATDSMHIEKEVVPATDNMYEKGEVPAPGAGPCPPTSSRDGTCSSSETEITDKDATTAMSQILEGGRSCSAFDENALKGMKSVPEADPCPPTSSRADTRIISETSMTGKDATTAMHQILEGGRSCSAFDENALKGMVPAPEADPCPPTSSPADTHISSEISMMNKDATTAMPQILEEGRLCSAFDKHALDEAVLKGKGELAKAEAAELNSQVKSSSLRETVKSLVLRLGLKFKRKPNSLHPKSITPIQ
eukprot:gene7401-529_t